MQAKNRGIGVIFITHNPHHGYPVGDHVVISRRAQILGDFTKDKPPLHQLVQMMAGGEDFESLSHELERAAGETGDPDLAEAVEVFGEEAHAADTDEWFEESHSGEAGR